MWVVHVLSENMSMGTLWLLFSYVLSKKRQRATSDAPCPDFPPAWTEAAAASAEGDLGIPMEDNLPGTSSRTSHSPVRLVPLVEFPDELGSSAGGKLNFSFEPPEGDEVSIPASEGGLMPSDAEGSAGLPPSGVVAQSEADAKMAAVLAQAAESIGLEYV